MISFPCPDCSGAIQHDSSLAGCTVACPHCGGSLLMPPAACALDVRTGIDPQAGVLDRAGGVLARHQRRRSRVPGLWTALSIAALLLIACLVVWSIGGNITDPTGKTTTDEQRWGSSAEAYEIGKKFATRCLYSPSTVRFQPVDEATITRDQHQRWHVSAYLDAQNAFGAVVRNDWSAVIRKNDDGTWRVDSVWINGAIALE